MDRFTSRFSVFWFNWILSAHIWFFVAVGAFGLSQLFIDFFWRLQLRKYSFSTFYLFTLNNITTQKFINAIITLNYFIHTLTYTNILIQTFYFSVPILFVFNYFSFTPFVVTLSNTQGYKHFIDRYTLPQTTLQKTIIPLPTHIC